LDRHKDIYDKNDPAWLCTHIITQHLYLDNFTEILEDVKLEAMIGALKRTGGIDGGWGTT